MEFKFMRLTGAISGPEDLSARKGFQQEFAGASMNPVPDSVGYKWSEIADLPSELDKYEDTELESLYRVWKKERNTISEEDLRSFSAQLAREWAIETGIIEGVYTLDRGVTQTLIERGIASAYIPH